MAIDSSLIQEIRDRADIVDIISSYINVNKKGRNFFAVCPFHDDHNPSLSINVEKKIFKCFVCGEGGDVFSFVSKYDHISYLDAIKKVAEMINYDDPRLHESPKFKQVDANKETLYNLINELQKFYEYGLSTDEGKIAKDYLINRHIDDAQIKKFDIGYALKDGSLAISYLTKKGYSLKNIEDIGISLVKTSGMKDNNAGRLIFPIKDYNGQIVGFSARRLNDSIDEAKYINTSETKIFSKGNILYNYSNAKQYFKRDSYLYVVEGFMDAIALDRIGVHSVVALMGTALTKTNAEMLKRSNVEIRLCLDNDKAGQMAMMSIISTFDQMGISYRIVLKNDIGYKDADEILNKLGEEALRNYISSLVDSFNFSLSYYTNFAPLEQKENKIKVIAHFTPMLANIKNELEFNDYIYKLAKITNFNVTAIKEYVEEYKINKNKENFVLPIFNNETIKEKQQVNKALKRLQKAEESLLKQMLINSSAIEFYEDNVKYFHDETLRQIANFIIEYQNKYGDINANNVISEILLSDLDNRENLKDIVTSYTYKDEAIQNIETLKDYLNVIVEERNKIYEKDLLKKASMGKDKKEQARLLNDYINRTNK